MKNRILVTFLLSLAIYLLPVASAFADGVSCQPIYGGGQTCLTIGNVIIDKKVMNPANNTFVDNLGINDPRYSPGFVANFRLEVTNSGNTNISKVEVKDILPQYVEFATGPGNFDAKTKTLTFALDNLAPNETRTFVIVGKIVGINQLPANQAIVCVVNQATATANGNRSQDNSQFCIEKSVATPKGGFPVQTPPAITTTPSTGPESFVLFAMAPLAGAGWLLRKYSLKKEDKN